MNGNVSRFIKIHFWYLYSWLIAVCKKVGYVLNLCKYMLESITGVHAYALQASVLKHNDFAIGQKHTANNMLDINNFILGF